MCVCVCVRAWLPYATRTGVSHRKRSPRCAACNATPATNTSTHSARSNALRGRSTRGLGAAPPEARRRPDSLTALSTVHWAGLGWLGSPGSASA